MRNLHLHHENWTPNPSAGLITGPFECSVITGTSAARPWHIHFPQSVLRSRLLSYSAAFIRTDKRPLIKPLPRPPPVVKSSGGILGIIKWLHTSLMRQVSPFATCHLFHCFLEGENWKKDCLPFMMLWVCLRKYLLQCVSWFVVQNALLRLYWA